MAKSKRGMSKDEKETAFVSYFLQHPVPFTLKELEKIGPKIGVTSMTVKDSVMAAVYDGLVENDKVGIQSLFWAFPSKAAQKREEKLAKIQSDVEKSRERVKQLKQQQKDLRKGREKTKERDQRLANLTKLRTFNADLHAGLEEFRENDPDILSRMEDASAVAKAATDRWTDNIDTVTSWLKTKSGLGDEQIAMAFGIPADLDSG
ncbi:MAG: putative meiotic nuclear division protein 1 [Streblomastix strix]|uniref:Putative meiotic nuclear division protein 1 n=1 Tax=Streblomastix strix TaxID=222440 RepID=A0A5J4VNU9_9EUKA|nr:MAG: putative meiotic nuclear division protein 1 [Streblomastix strix]